MYDADDSIGYLSKSSIIRIGGRRYRVGIAGCLAQRLVIDLRHSIRVGHSCFFLRPQIRAVQRDESTSILTKMIESAPDMTTRLIAIWLRGRCGGSLGTDLLRAFATSPEVRLRIAAAKALRQMHGWAALKEFEADASMRVRNLAASRARRSFKDRVGDFLPHLSTIATRNRNRPTYVAPTVNLDARLPIRSLESIRRLLLRIRQLVRGETV
jgi:hypothetical protein